MVRASEAQPAAPVQARILVACSEPETLRSLASILWQCGAKPLVASTQRGAKAAIATFPVYLAVCEDHLPDGGFEAIFDSLATRSPRARLLVCSRLAEVDRYLKAMNMGAYDYICSSYRFPEIKAVLDGSLRELSFKKPSVGETPPKGRMRSIGA